MSIDRKSDYDLEKQSPVSTPPSQRKHVLLLETTETSEVDTSPEGSTTSSISPHKIECVSRIQLPTGTSRCSDGDRDILDKAVEMDIIDAETCKYILFVITVVCNCIARQELSLGATRLVEELREWSKRFMADTAGSPFLVAWRRHQICALVLSYVLAFNKHFAGAASEALGRAFQNYGTALALCGKTREAIPQLDAALKIFLKRPSSDVRLIVKITLQLAQQLVAVDPEGARLLLANEHRALHSRPNVPKSLVEELSNDIVKAVEAIYSHGNDCAVARKRVLDASSQNTETNSTNSIKRQKSVEKAQLSFGTMPAEDPAKPSPKSGKDSPGEITKAVARKSKHVPTPLNQP